MTMTLEQLKKAFEKTNTIDGSGMPRIPNCSLAERDEYVDMIKIVQTVMGIEHIASNGEVFQEPLVAPFRDRMRELIERDKDIGEKRDAWMKELNDDARDILAQIKSRHDVKQKRIPGT